MYKSLTFATIEDARAKVADLNARLGLPRKNTTPGVEQWVIDAGVTTTVSDIKTHPTRQEFAIQIANEIELTKSETDAMTTIDESWSNTKGLRP